jgi:hypothetical protein
MIKHIVRGTVNIALLISIIIGFSLLGIWSINALFPALAIPYTWKTCTAFVVLFASLASLHLISRNKK